MPGASRQDSGGLKPRCPVEQSDDDAHEGRCSPSAGTTPRASDLARSPSCRRTSSPTFPPAPRPLRAPHRNHQRRRGKNRIFSDAEQCGTVVVRTCGSSQAEAGHHTPRIAARSRIEGHPVYPCTAARSSKSQSPQRNPPGAAQSGARAWRVHTVLAPWTWRSHGRQSLAESVRQ
jgi:hypothetical protein